MSNDIYLSPSPENIASLPERLKKGGDHAILQALDLCAVSPGEVVSALWSHAGNASTLGITGTPGVGKSTLIPGLVYHMRSREETLAILAVDPSSMKTGGSLLADRAQMEATALGFGYSIGMEDGVWLRSFASGGSSGGVSEDILPAILTFDIAGKDRVLIETVGVGQAELEISMLADTTVLVMQPESGNSLQAAKAGILEAADVVCVNKKDLFTRGARLSFLDTLRSSRHRFTLVETDAKSGEGLDDLLEAIDEHRDSLSDEELAKRRQRSLIVQLSHISTLSAARVRVALRSKEGEELLEEVGSRQKDPFKAAHELIGLATE